MKKIYFLAISCLFFIASVGVQNSYGQAGTASASEDSICVDDNTTLILTGYNGTIQWQIFNGVVWANETNTGSNTDMYTVLPGAPTQYRAVVTDPGGVMDTSNVVSIFVNIVSPPTAVNASRCGIGPITLTASGIGLTTWYVDSLTLEPLHEGDTFNTSITETTTYYVSTVDTNSSGSGGSGNPVTFGGTFGATNGSTENGFNVINISGFDIQINTINWEWDLGTGDVAVMIQPTGGTVANASSGAGWIVYETFTSITANGANTGTPTTFTTPLIIPAGATVGIAFDVVSGSITNSYQTGNGTPWVSTEFMDANLIITEGQAGGPPGGGLGGFSPRNFWGTFEYEFANDF
ncbi:MAG: hypothetical protein HKN22_01100, partial [Bacteroidia bacterium]|nr:hypothetical protein [Bacteroidia bacterium]